MAEASKDTIYVDVDDEITGVIDKVVGSKKKVVALVLPKRASVFQSIVNMKLLKRKSDEANKNLVLVTADAGLLPLAGAVGIHVSKTLSSKPEIPAAPVIGAAMVEAHEGEALSAIGQEAEEPIDLSEIANEPVGELEDKQKATPSDKPSSSSPTSKSAKDKDLDTIELDNSKEGEKATDTAMPAVAKAKDKKKDKGNKNKKLKVPNFERFRLWTVLGAAAIIILVVLWILLFKVFPHATINIKTNAQNVDASLTFNMSTTATKLNTNTNTVPAKSVSETKTYTATVNSTGQQNNGQKASGTVNMTAQECGTSAPNDVPAGTGITANGNTYITQGDTTFVIHSGPNHGCFTYDSTNSTSITAQNGGSAYNVSSANFSVSGRSDVSASGSASGGTDNNVTVVSQADISNAENKISANNAGAKSDLTNELTSANYYPLNATFTSSTPNISPNASAGTAASSVTVTETIKYTMYGVIKSDLNKLLNSTISSQVTGNQTIINNGLSSAVYSVGSNPNSVSMESTAIVGPNININNLKKEVSGQNVSAIQSIVKSNSDVSSVSVKLSPFYVSKAPTPSKITINVAKPTNNPSNASSN